MTGTLINVATVVAGSSIGLLINRNLPERFIKIVFQVMGIFTLFLGFSMALKTSEILLLILSMVTGAIIGEWINLDAYFSRFSDFLKLKSKSKNEKFTEGFITSFLLFCIGSMTILGAIEEGLGGKPNLLLAKSIMDGFSSVALASAFGFGVMLSVIPLLLYQGLLTIGASYLDVYLTELLVNELTACGGLILIALGINILEIKKLSIVNMIPSLVIVVLMNWLF